MIGVAAESLHVHFGDRAILSGISLACEGPGLTAIIGPNGAGKSTLLRTLCGLVQPRSGQVLLDGKPLMDRPRQHRARAVGYLPQHHAAAWAIPVQDIVGLGRMPWAGAAGEPQAVHDAMAVMDILHLANRPLTALSGGERSRVMLARLLAGDHRLLLCDEPLSHADPRHQSLMMNALRARADAGATVLVVMHDLALAARYAQRIIVLQHGQLVADGTPHTVLTRQFIADIFGIASVVEDRSGTLLVAPWI